MRNVLSIFAILFATLTFTGVLPACGGSDSDCPVGSEGCECTAGGGCDTGLACRSRVCVDLNATCGQAAAGGVCEEICTAMFDCEDNLVANMEQCVDSCEGEISLPPLRDNVNTCPEVCELTNGICGHQLFEDCDALCGGPGEGEAEAEGESEPCQ